MKLRLSGIRRLIAVLILLFVGLSAHALEQMQNASFTSSYTGWTPAVVLGDLQTLTADIDAANGNPAGSFKIQGKNNSNASPVTSGTVTLTQSFPSSGTEFPSLTTQANVEIQCNYKLSLTSASGKTVYLSFRGTIFRNSDTASMGTLIYLSWPWTSTTATTSSWINSSSWTSTLSPGASFSLSLKSEMIVPKGAVTNATLWIDQVFVNISPQGLTATETSNGRAQLSWSASTCPPNVPPLATATDSYRIYRSLTSGGSWSFASSTSSTSWSEEPLGDTVYYCITDVDTSETESPKSVVATFTRPRLRITTIEAPESVSIGQTGIPVKVRILNEGQATGYFGGASLTFSPDYDNYTWSLLSPAIGTSISPSASITADFSVNVLENSEYGVYTINATASETRDAGSCSVGDAGADTPAEWMIRPPANLHVSSVVTPSVVYRAQANIPVEVTVENIGGTNAAGYWDISTLKFSNGTYNNITPPAGLPVLVTAGTPVMRTYYVEVDPLSATGPAVVDAWITYRDITTLIPTANNDGATSPGNWTIMSGVITTYRDAARTVSGENFTQGNYSVFARTQNLIPSKEHRLRWYDPNGVEVASSDPAITTSESGAFDDELALSPASPQGAWRVECTQSFDSEPLCVSSFTVGTPALGTLSLQLPATVGVGGNFTATLTFGNIGSATVLDAEPATLTRFAANTGTATWISGPSPDRQDILGETEETFTYTLQANSAGNFQLQVSAQGYDENASTSPLITAATVSSNICVIQPPPTVSITSLSESYTNVSPGQEDLVVSMNISNTGSAAAYIDGASLTHSLAGHTQTIASPTTLPYLLAGGKSTTFVFYVDVSESATTGTDNITGSFGGYDAGNPNYRLSATGGTANWTITAFQGMLSANSSYSPEQYIFNAGQRVYVKFTGLLTTKAYHISVYDPSEALFGSDSPSSDQATVIGYDFDTSTGAPGIYRVDLVKDQGTIQESSLYFSLMKNGQLSSALSLSPASVDLGASITVSLFVWNPVSNGAMLRSTTPTTPVATANSSGSVVLLSGPTPASATISPNEPATFTWVFLTTAHTSLGSLAMIASATGTDANTYVATTTSATSNSMTIIQRSIRLSSDTLDFGSMSCNTAKTVSPTRVENLGNANLTNVSWQTNHLAGPASSTIDRSNIVFSPANGFGVAVSGTQNASATFAIPYNTPTGSYVATCGVYDDYKPANGAQSLGEPQDGFQVAVSVANTALLIVNDDLIDLGIAQPDSPSATATVSAFNGGNTTLTNLRFIPSAATLTNPITVTPAETASLATNGSLLAYISTSIHASEVTGTYIATFSLSSDQATDTFQVLIRVGIPSITVDPAELDGGERAPNSTVSSLSFSITNTGSVSLSHMTFSRGDLYNPDADTTILKENISIQLPATIAPGETVNGTMSIYIPSCFAAGLYYGTQYIFDDVNSNDLSDESEASCNFLAYLTVTESSAIDVGNSTIELGNLSPGSTGQLGFLCRNTGNTSLSSLNWIKSNLTSDAPGTLSAGSYNFLAPATVAPGENFIASIAYTIPADQTSGEYYTANCRIYNDNPANGLDASDPQDQFALHCRIGQSSINIIEATTQLDSSYPSQTTDEVQYSFTNNGTIALSRPCATMTTDLTSGGNTIPRSNVLMSPAVFSVANPGQNKTGAWQVQVPALTPVGSFTGTLLVWNDDDADGIVDAGEANDTMTISLGVSELPAINVVQEPLNLYFIPAGKTKSGTFEVQNIGNVDLGNFTLLAVGAELNPAVGYPIAAPTISISTASNGYATGTVTVSVPDGRSDGVYSGVQTVYVDVNENGIFDSGSDPYTTFTLTLTVGEKKMSADSPVQFGLRNPGIVTEAVQFNLHNLKSLGISNGRWLTPSGGGSFPLSGMTVTPDTFTIGPNADKSCTVSLAISATQAPGDYVATRTAFEDDNGNGSIDMYEASAPVQITVTVATYPHLDIIPATLVASSVAGGEAITHVEFQIYNSGNVEFNNLVWNPSELFMGAYSLPTPTLESIVPTLLPPGEYGTGTIAFAPIDIEQFPGPYIGSQNLYDSVLQPTYSGAADSVSLTFIVRGPDLGFASIYQKVASSTFSASAPANRYIISGWVCPGSGSAGIGVFRADRNGYNKGFDGVIISSNGVLTNIGTPVDAGILESYVTKNASYSDSTFTWYRVYAAFDYTFDPAVASSTWIGIKNYSPTTASHAVWFDGVQLEKHTVLGQKRPTPFTHDRKIVTPRSDTSTEVGKSYFEW